MQFVFPNISGTLEEFAAWYKANEYPVRPPFEDCVYVTDNSYSYVLFRQGCFQAEVYLVKPDSGSPDHSHPGVENIILLWGGDAYPSFDGVRSPVVRSIARADGTSSCFGVIGPKITDAHTHALHTGPKGAAFLSLEKWPEDVKPTSVIVNWKGAAIGDEHATQIQPLNGG
jgi:hypothetical protein